MPSAPAPSAKASSSSAPIATTTVASEATPAPTGSASQPTASAAPTPPQPLSVHELLASNAKDGDEVEVRGYYVHDRNFETSPAARYRAQDWTMSISEDNSSERVAFCYTVRDPGAELGDLVTVRGKIHTGALINPCVVESVSKRRRDR